MVLKSLRYQFPDMQSYSALKYQSMQQMDESIDGWDGGLYTTGNPVYFTIFEGKAMLFPIPDQSMTNGIKVLYNQKPTDVVLTSDSPSLPLIYHNTIVKYCMWQASLLDEDDDPAVMYLGNFTQDLQTLQNNEVQDATSAYASITTLDYDM